MLLDQLFPSLGSVRRSECSGHGLGRKGFGKDKIRLRIFALGLSAMMCAYSARADVLDISQDGSVTTYKVPSIFRTEGVSPILAAPRRDHNPAPAAPAIRNLLAVAASRYAIPVNLLTAVAWRESHFQAEAVSPKGAVGVMQLMDGTARDLGVDRYDLSQNILGGAAYFRQMIDRFGGNEALALAAYNAGPEAVVRANGIPQFRETRDYVGAILDTPSLVLSDY